MHTNIVSLAEVKGSDNGRRVSVLGIVKTVNCTFRKQ